MLALLALSQVAAAPVVNSTAALKTTCPSLYGPGSHTIELRIVDPDTGFAWLRSFELFIPDSMPLSEQRPSVVNWHGCGSDPERYDSESEMNDRVGRYSYYSRSVLLIYQIITLYLDLHLACLPLKLA